MNEEEILIEEAVLTEENNLSDETESLEAINDLIEVIISDDRMTSFLKLSKRDKGKTIFSREDLLQALQEEKIIFGINENSVVKLAKRPIFNIQIKVAEGMKPIDGKDGSVSYLVKRDEDYHLDYDEDENIDYKSQNYFQMVEKNQILCEITPEENGIDGKNVFGQSISAKKGRKPFVTVGKNTSFNEDKTKLIANCDGIVRFLKNTIHINEMLRINSDVDFSTGNISFPGDVSIDGDVSSGFSVKSGGNINIKGVVEAASIEAAGNVRIGKGIYGGSGGVIEIGKDLQCGYIENATLQVGGNIKVDYIIAAKITCSGNINLVGRKEMIVGGEVTLTGKLKAKEIGNQREYPTIIKILGKETVDEAAIALLEKGIKENIQTLEALDEKKVQINIALLSQERKHILDKDRDSDASKKMAMLKIELDKESIILEKKIEVLKEELEKIKGQIYTEYSGSIEIKSKLYQGTKVYFGDLLFQHELDNLDRCRIYFYDDQIVNGLL